MFKKRWLDIPVGYRRLIFLLAAILILISTAVIGFMFLEDLSFFDSLWMTIISVMTIGYGDMYPVTEDGRRFALFLVPLGAGIVTYGLGTAASYLIEKQLSQKVWEKQMDNEIEKLQDHIIICGFGRVGKHVYHQLRDQEKEVKILCVHDDEEELLQFVDKGTLRLIGDPTDHEVLEKARINKAKGLIAAVDNDADNVFITLTAKGINEDLKVAARVEKEGSEEVLLRAGASRVINPSSLGGRELAMSVLKPAGTDYINNLMRADKKDFVVGESTLESGSPLLGKSLEDSHLRRDYGFTLLAIMRGEEVISNPDLDVCFEEGDTLLVVGDDDCIRDLNERVGGRTPEMEEQKINQNPEWGS
ncbi:potassium channel family protein [Edaphobacillus lindanitolerans]|uniref:Voltage-gated potassium channel n=1 Tax=Edaphobacillus lindanitolerans TaxID=550447 RepID=A0A1U7PNZ3_9BACI|nr:potassium channel protein [Edaphobacillus lindanitolerans]SIT75059.1 voltage-gated potassium channel [Edaphobacillus lindanitolerans]